MFNDSCIWFFVRSIVDYGISLIVLFIKNFSLEPNRTIFQRTVTIIIILIDTAGIEVGSIKEISSIEIAEKVAKAHQEATELANEFSSNNLKGMIISEEQRKQISESLKGHPVSEETRKKNGDAHRGLKWNDEQKAKLSAIRMGHPDYLTDEGRQRIKEANRRNKLGTKASEETRKKMSERQKGKHSQKRKPLTEEQKKHLSEKLKGRKISDEQKAKLSALKKGRKYITVNGKKKLAPLNYINNVEENNEQ